MACRRIAARTVHFLCKEDAFRQQRHAAVCRRGGIPRILAESKMAATYQK